MKLQRIGLCIFAWLQGCSVLVGNSFDDYMREASRETDAGAKSGKDAGDIAEKPADAGQSKQETGGAGGMKAEAGAGGSKADKKSTSTRDAGVDAGKPQAGASAAGSGGATGATGSTLEDDTDGGVDDQVTLLPPMVPCEGPTVVQFPFNPPIEDLARWTIRADPVDAMKNLAIENRDGSPKKGALEASMTFTDSRQSFQVVTTLDAVVPTKCISFRLKVVEDPGNPDLSNTKAAWYIFAVDADGCYAQSEIPFAPWWRYDITQAGIWYEASANTPELTTSQMCTHFDASRVQKVGVGFATSSSLLWRARVVLDTIRVH